LPQLLSLNPKTATEYFLAQILDGATPVSLRTTDGATSAKASAAVNIPKRKRTKCGGEKKIWIAENITVMVPYESQNMKKEKNI